MGKYIKNFIYKDRNLIAMLARTNVATEEQVRVFMGLRRIESHIREGLLEKITLVTKDRGQEQQRELYRLTQRGKEIAREQCNVSSLYASNSVRHDLALTERYIELYKRDPALVEHWITENDYKVMLQEKVLELREQAREYEANQMEADIRNKLYSALDGGYQSSDGTIHAIEVITRHYKEADIVAKANTIGALNISSCNEIYIN